MLTEGITRSERVRYEELTEQGRAIDAKIEELNEQLRKLEFRKLIVVCSFCGTQVDLEDESLARNKKAQEKKLQEMLTCPNEKCKCILIGIGRLILK